MRHLIGGNLPPQQFKGPRVRAPAVTPLEFIGQHPVFRLEEFIKAHPHLSARSVASILQYHVRQGRLLNPRRRVYMRMPVRGGPSIDPWALGSRLTKDAVIAYDGALSFHGFTGLGHRISVASTERIRYFVYNEVVYSSVADDGLLVPWTWKVERDGVRFKVWSPEQAVAGCLDRLELGPGLERLTEIFLKHDFDAQALAGSAALRSVIARVRLGVLMDLHETLRARFLVIDRLLKDVPKQPVYFDPRKPPGGRYWLKWNCIVPKWLAKRYPEI